MYTSVTVPTNPADAKGQIIDGKFVCLKKTVQTVQAPILVWTLM